MSGKQSHVLAVAGVSVVAFVAFVFLRNQPSPIPAEGSKDEPEATQQSGSPSHAIEASNASRTPHAAESGSPAQTTTPQGTTGSVPKWLETIAHQCKLTSADVARIMADPDKMRDGRRVWQEFAVGVGDAYLAKAEVSKRICADRQAKGHYEVYDSKARLPDEDPNLGDHIFFHSEPNPKGGASLVRVIRVFPGEHPDLDQAAQALRSLQATRRAAMLEILKP
jgi:Spy/CpxP family protein refolding chaperone